MNRVFAGVSLALVSTLACAQARPHTAPQYHIYAGNTHAHTAFTWSHGEMLAKNGCKGIQVYGLKPGTEVLFDWTEGYKKGTGGCHAIYVINGWQYHTPDMKLKPDWQKYQGPPSAHFALAKANGYDFYVTTDHSQESAFFPLGPNNPQWMHSKQEAAAATDKDFVALAGFEYSENDGPGGTGHINVINTDSITNALLPGVDLTAFYKWLAVAKPNGAGPVIASFNHPSPHSYADFTGRTPAATERIALLEVINSNSHIHYEGWLAALDAGWKVSPTSGLDVHGLTGIPKDKSRVFVLATARTKLGILDAMQHRRTYASLDNNIQCRYTVNGAIMGSTLQQPGTYRFDISITDPDSNDPRAKITKLDIVKDGGEVVQTYTPDQPSTTVNWKPVIKDKDAHYFFVRVWNAGGGDAPRPDASKPVAWLAPVWTGKPSPMKPMLKLSEIKSNAGAPE
ncbi:MAG: CehA/McbA family metallohydrolase [Acidobacteria bacterium]|nr:CehA/McbA family metallohydrolase [Acidobacteriota bacterium]